jgi:hypothetical protein
MVLYALAMVLVIVGVDLLLFRDRPWPRLMANVGIVLVFTSCYVRFTGRPSRTIPDGQCGRRQRAVDTPCSVARARASVTHCSAPSRPLQDAPSTDLPGSRSL